VDECNVGVKADFAYWRPAGYERANGRTRCRRWAPLRVEGRPICHLHYSRYIDGHGITFSDCVFECVDDRVVVVDVSVR
jgi:hypothetical protein